MAQFGPASGAEDAPRPGLLGLCVRGTLKLCWRLVMVSATLATLVLLAAFAIFLRLQMGPLALPGLAEPVAKLISERSDEYRLEIGEVIVSLGGRQAPAGVQFADVRATTPEGELLMSAPRVAARFHFSDLIQGEVRPTRLVLIRPEAQVRRSVDGRFRTGIGAGEGLLLGGEGGGGDPAAQFDAIARVMDGFVGDMEPVD
ncbi:MAG: hypothetical protein AAF908_06905, partial [Pseudomonadota bacterium]